MRLLDLFCGAGGAAMGYHRAGFEVVGVDIAPQPHYPFEFIQADALTFPLEGFDAIHASPPCQGFSVASVPQRRKGISYASADLLPLIRERLIASGKPWIIENVVGAPLLNPVRLCGSTFGLLVVRHRIFESNQLLFGAGPCLHFPGCVRRGPYVTVCGGGTSRKSNRNLWGQVMDIDWMSKKEITQAIPPAYTEWLGRQLLAALQPARSA